MTNLSERIRAIAPGNAAYYRLTAQRNEGQVRIYPTAEGAYYHVGEAPEHAPPGSYLLSYYDREFRPIAHPAQTFVINPPSEFARAPQGQLSLSFPGSGHRGSTPSAEAAPAAAPAMASSAPVAVAPKPSEAFAADTFDPEYRQHLHAMDLEDRQQDFIKNSTYIKEVGELFLLNRLMRREMMEMQRSMVLHSQQAFRDIEQVKATIHGLLGLQDAVLAHAEKHQRTPPAPPPDYVGLGHSALALLKDVGVALVQRWQPDRTGAPAAPPQLPAASLPPGRPPASGAPEPARSPDVLERIAARLKALSEFELAQAMSSPHGWTTLLEDLRSAPRREPADAASTPALGLEG